MVKTKTPCCCIMFWPCWGGLQDKGQKQIRFDAVLGPEIEFQGFQKEHDSMRDFVLCTFWLR